VLAARPDSALAYFCSPTDVFAIPASARARSQLGFSEGRSSSAALALARASLPALRPGAFSANVAGDNPRLPLVDSLVVQQGPNYFFAKRLQHWRALVAKADGHVVSSNVAPASNTQSVLKNPLLAAAFGGAALVDLVIFEPGTSNALMTYLLLHDLHAQAGGASPARVNAGCPPRAATAKVPPPPLDDGAHPLLLFATTAAHNGVWTSPWQLRSVVEAVVLAKYARSAAPHLVALAAVLGAVVQAAGIGPAIPAARL
jgi:hypothetical protein